MSKQAINTSKRYLFDISVEMLLYYTVPGRGGADIKAPGAECALPTIAGPISISKGERNRMPWAVWRGIDLRYRGNFAATYGAEFSDPVTLAFFRLLALS
ncbi:hypothetical protein J2W22_000456 [Sphingomonas kyeonggiensis]|uniref:hypothetical protein n=1 Tax=Sphingomonas kyeonggiensis TaxID=1268553 RepID=UPI002781E46D|nr:hypothetical protein [Sphingomonas kyeonggiensis]MDQ0248409.1 hypothetical protein [Sphingomonas kyeonggiensis]